MIKKILVFLIIILSSIGNSRANELYDWNKVILAIADVESGYNEKIVSPCGKFVGYLQISKVMIDDCNNIAKYKKFTYNDRFSKKKSIEIFYFVQSHYNPENNVEKAIRLWKGGTGYTVKSTNTYYKKVLNKLKKLT